MDYTIYIEDHTVRQEISYRGGGIEIDLSDLFPYLDEARMTAYQNYLGGGMLGRICNSYNFDTNRIYKRDKKKLQAITDTLNRYFHNLTNHEGNEWEEETYEHNQLTKPESAY